MQVDHNDVYFSFLPLAHIFDRVAEEMFVFVGGSIGFWQGVCLLEIIGLDRFGSVQIVKRCFCLQSWTLTKLTELLLLEYRFAGY